MSIQASFKAASYLILLGAMSCTWDQATPKFDCSLSPIEIEILERIESECASPTGGFTISSSGGEAPYTFSSEAGSSTDGVFNNVGAGSYIVTVSDVNGCTAEAVVEILNEDGVNLGEVKVVDAACGSTDGQIEIEVSGGLAPYSFRLNEGQEQESNTFSGLTSGIQNIQVVDSDGCIVTKSVTVFSGVSFNSSIEGIIKNNCTSCHGVSASPSFDSYDEIKTHAAAIKRRTGNRSMPKDATMSQDEIDMIACWVNDGALSN